MPVDAGVVPLHLISFTNTMATVAAASTPTGGFPAEKTGTEVKTNEVKIVVSPNGNGGGAVPIVE